MVKDYVPQSISIMKVEISFYSIFDNKISKYPMIHSSHLVHNTCVMHGKVCLHDPVDGGFVS